MTETEDSTDRDLEAEREELLSLISENIPEKLAESIAIALEASASAKEFKLTVSTEDTGDANTK